MTAPAELPPLALYLHFPWCVRKCPYCDFNSHPLGGKLPEAAYVAALLADLRASIPMLSGRKPVSLFLGGGTPSLFSSVAIGRLLEGINHCLPWQVDAEISMEANPGTISAADFATWRATGINRLSLGIQSFNADSLRSLERIHSAQEARRAAELASRHFDSFNLDLMYGLPGQTLAMALADLEQALSFGPSHLSCYQLTLEPETRFTDSPPVDMPDDDLCADMQEAIEDRLVGAGYIHYETSAFARPGQQCRHNLNYWQFGDYLGIGAGAHSKLTGVWGILRQSRLHDPECYQRSLSELGEAIADKRALSAPDLPLEFLMNALRLNHGFDPALFTQRTGLPLSGIDQELRAAAQEGLLRYEPDHLAPTRRGRLFLNQLLERWMSDVAKTLR